MTVYSLGVWTVRAGLEDEFVQAWLRLAEQTRADFPEARGTLLRDRDRPGTFISFGPWDSPETMSRWRTSAGFQQAVAAIRETLDRFEPHDMDLVADVG